MNCGVTLADASPPCTRHLGRHLVTAANPFAASRLSTSRGASDGTVPKSSSAARTAWWNGRKRADVAGERGQPYLDGPGRPGCRRSDPWQVAVRGADHPASRPSSGRSASAALVHRSHAGLTDDRLTCRSWRPRRSGPCHRLAGHGLDRRPTAPGPPSSLVAVDAVGEFQVGRAAPGRRCSPRPAPPPRPARPRNRLIIDSRVRSLRARMPCTPMISDDRTRPEQPFHTVSTRSVRTPSTKIKRCGPSGRRGPGRRVTRISPQPRSVVGSSSASITSGAGLGVQGAGRLIGQQHLGAPHQRPGRSPPAAARRRTSWPAGTLARCRRCRPGPARLERLRACAPGAAASPGR